MQTEEAKLEMTPEMLAIKQKREQEQRTVGRIYNDPSNDNICDGCA